MKSGKSCGFSQTSPLGHRYSSSLSDGSFIWILVRLPSCAMEFQRRDLTLEM